MEKKTKNKMMAMAVLTGMAAAAGYMYMKKNPNMVDNMKDMAKDLAKDAYDKLDDIA